LFMGNLCFETKLCKPRHPFTKGAVERLVRFVKDNFLPGRSFNEITDLNYEAIRWCNAQNSIYHRAVDCIPNDKHAMACMRNATVLEESIELSYYLCPERKISFDGFVHYDGRRFGVPYWYTGKPAA
ncbi:MAG: transposase, partial [Lachnospiraceae bacterium]|nr:transposase [Lachnospiraceae bacterium]